MATNSHFMNFLSLVWCGVEFILQSFTEPFQEAGTAVSPGCGLKVGAGGGELVIE